MIEISKTLHIALSEIDFKPIRSPGPGGQNVNKVATGVLLRFNILKSSLPETIRNRLLQLSSHFLTQDADIIIKATRFRTQERNKQDAIERLQVILRQASITPKKRKKTKPTYASVERRLNKKKLLGKRKSLRGTPYS